MIPPEGESPQEAEQINELLESSELAHAIDTEEFRVFLDHIPIAIVVSRMLTDSQRIVYANKAYEALAAQPVKDIAGKNWSVLDSFTLEDEPHSRLSEALENGEDFVGTFKREQPTFALVEVYTGVIENEDAGKAYRLVALIDVTQRERAQREEFARQLRSKDILLKELQHRVKNNLQLIIALIRLDARSQRGASVDLSKLAGRIESMKLLYEDLTAEGLGQAVDLGHYVGQIATAVMHTFGVEGITLDLKVDYAPTSVNVAMPVGLLVNELLTNAFKYAFSGRNGGTLTVRCLLEPDARCRVVVADDGIGLPEETAWPLPGKLGALILQSLRENTKTDFEMISVPGEGTHATISFEYQPAAPKRN